MSEPTIEERVARLERHAGLPMGVKEGEARARGWRYFMFDPGNQLFRAKPTGMDSYWSGRAWLRTDADLAYWQRRVSGGAAIELTESEAVQRFGREIIEDQSEDDKPDPPKTLAAERSEYSSVLRDCVSPECVESDLRHVLRCCSMLSKETRDIVSAAADYYDAQAQGGEG